MTVHSSLPTPHSSRILVVAPSWIGDTILAQPLFVRLHERGAMIDVLAPAWSAPLLQRMPQIRRVIESPFRHGDFAFFARRALGRQLAAAHYAAAYVLPNSWKSALVPFFAGIPERIGYQGEARFGLLNRRHKLDEAELPQLAQRYARLADPAGSTRVPPLPAPHLASSREQQQAARHALGLPLDASPVIFCPGAEYGPAKRWPAPHFAALAQRLGSQADPVWILGSAADQVIGDSIVERAGACAVNLCGRTSLEQAIDLIAAARLVVSNDSGLMHVAAALERPLLALYGSSSPVYTPPLSTRAKIVTLNVECSPCFQRQCPLGHFKCMEGMAPDYVLSQSRTL
ncbi:ADP-heptose--LPS heptosyltransferase 2 [Georgfuchsia toluolica]|uniref:lipopolysaccharide heptosyltransferase II n=1 Tax=Georgfuchsia toluolica TaxID=424218 RepID=A0A916J5G6_9PROT|nr:lipopolysaccharide heptosyltransferase II [Georgfuchsia toluolica]CAG4885051.1 ADP-heptose--LPS heptosyltransferase 2 [Georgfuchsia toluolica]